MLVMTCAASAATPLMAAHQRASFLEMTVLLFGGHAAMRFTCNAYRSGWVHRRSSAAPCAVEHGSSKQPQQRRIHSDSQQQQKCPWWRNVRACAAGGAAAHMHASTLVHREP